MFDRERPLGAAIEAARAALEKAKALDGKNGLGISVQTASGSEWTAVDHWGEGWSRMRDALRLRCTDRLSSGWVHDVEEFLRSLPDSALQSATSLDAIRAELKRLTRRRTTSQEEADHVWDDELRGATWLLNAADQTVSQSVSNQLHVIAFLAREARP